MKTIYKKYSLFIFTSILVFAISSCTSKKEHKHSGDNHKEEHNEEEHEEGAVYLNTKQVKSISVKLGELENIKVNNYIKVNGVIDLPPNAYASVTAKTSGIISGSRLFVEGKSIRKGELIAYLENPNFIEKQQSYLEAKAQLSLELLELKRQEKLMNEKAGVPKKLQKAKADVAILRAKTMGLAKQLDYLGLPISQLTTNTIRKRISITAPASGFISSINVHDGMFAQPEVPLMKIISDQHLHLEFDVFEKDIPRIVLGQKITYQVPALGSTVFQGEVSIIGKEFDKNSKTIRVHGHLDGKKPLFLKDLFIVGKIWLTDKTSLAVPDNALINDGASSFIYVGMKKSSDNYIFKKLMVIALSSNNGYTAIKLLNEIPAGMLVVKQGTYYIHAQSKVGELEHSH